METKINLSKGEITKNEKNSKILLLRKFNSLSSNKILIKSEVKDSFNSPEKFLCLDSKIIVNRKINLKKMFPLDDDTKQNINKTIGKGGPHGSLKYVFHRLNTFKGKSIIYNKFNEEQKEEKSSIKNIELIDKEQLKSIFISYKKASAKFFKRNSNLIKDKEKNVRDESLLKDEEYDKNIPRQLSIDLGVQNRRLLTKKSSDKKSRLATKYLSRKIHKKENDLLINNVQLYRYKKEIKGKEELKDNYDKINNQGCLFKWTSSLRKPKKFIGKRESYINIGGENNPLWSIIVERYPNIKEISVESGYNLDNKDFKDFIKKANINSKSNQKIQKVENLDEIKIQGKNLYKLEYNREMSGNKKKILHNIFIDNGKIIMYKDVNDIYGHQTIYKNYEGRNYNRNKRLGYSKGNQSAEIINKMSLKY